MTSQGTVAKYLSEGRGDYVPLDSRWRCGSGMTPPHSTQRTLPALCSSSKTQSEIRRLCVQVQGGLIVRDCGACPDPSMFTVHLRDGTYVLLTDLRYRSSLVSVMQDQNMGRWAVPLLILSVEPNGSNYISL